MPISCSCHPRSSRPTRHARGELERGAFEMPILSMCQVSNYHRRRSGVYEMVTVPIESGDEYRSRVVLSPEVVADFVRFSGDDNPLHLRCAGRP